jgi:hypothetical protein
LCPVSDEVLGRRLKVRGVVLSVSCVPWVGAM